MRSRVDATLQSIRASTSITRPELEPMTPPEFEPSAFVEFEPPISPHDSDVSDAPPPPPTSQRRRDRGASNPAQPSHPTRKKSKIAASEEDASGSEEEHGSAMPLRRTTDNGRVRPDPQLASTQPRTRVHRDGDLDVLPAPEDLHEPTIPAAKPDRKQRVAVPQLHRLVSRPRFPGTSASQILGPQIDARREPR